MKFFALQMLEKQVDEEDEIESLISAVRATKADGMSWLLWKM